MQRERLPKNRFGPSRKMFHEGPRDPTYVITVKLHVALIKKFNMKAINSECFKCFILCISAIYLEKLLRSTKLKICLRIIFMGAVKLKIAINKNFLRILLRLIFVIEQF